MLHEALYFIILENKFKTLITEKELKHTCTCIYGAREGKTLIENDRDVITAGL